MATTTVSYDGDGAQVDFTITYAYTAQSFIEVFVDGGTKKIVGTDYNFLSATVIRFEGASTPPAGTLNVELRRVTGTAPLVDWEDGASILDSDLDLADLQLLHIVEELENNVISGMGKTGANWDAEGVRITDVAAAIDDTDVATKASIATQVTAAETAETNAETAETAAVSAKDDAVTAQVASEAAEDSSLAAAATIINVFPVSGLTTGRTLVATAATTWTETQTRALELVDFKVATNDASIVLALGTTYNRYMLEMVAYRPDTDPSDLRMTVSVDSESTYENAGYDIRYTELKGSASNNSQSNEAFFKMNKQSLGKATSNRENHSFEISIFPGGSSEPFHFFGQGVGRAADQATVLFTIGGQLESSESALKVTHIKFVSSSGNLGTGSWRLWGIRV